MYVWHLRMVCRVFTFPWTLDAVILWLSLFYSLCSYSTLVMRVSTTQKWETLRNGSKFLVGVRYFYLFPHWKWPTKITRGSNIKHEKLIKLWQSWKLVLQIWDSRYRYQQHWNSKSILKRFPAGLGWGGNMGWADRAEVCQIQQLYRCFTRVPVPAFPYAQ